MNNNIMTNNIMTNNKNDDDMMRIKTKIDILNSAFKHGPISSLIKIFVSWMVTLEINNGSEKITIQEILLEIKNRIETLNILFSELSFGLETIEDLDKRKYEKYIFRNKIYKLFDLGDLVTTIIVKCVTFGNRINKILPTIISYLKPYTVILVDSLLLTDTFEEFQKKIDDYIIEWVGPIEDPVKRKMEKIKLLNNLLVMTVEEKIDLTYYSKNKINFDDLDKNKLKDLDTAKFIELTEIVHKKSK